MKYVLLMLLHFIFFISLTLIYIITNFLRVFKEIKIDDFQKPLFSYLLII